MGRLGIRQRIVVLIGLGMDGGRILTAGIGVRATVELRKVFLLENEILFTILLLDGGQSVHIILKK
jgi:hypothetical protein